MAFTGTKRQVRVHNLAPDARTISQDNGESLEDMIIEWGDIPHFVGSTESSPGMVVKVLGGRDIRSWPSTVLR